MGLDIYITNNMPLTKAMAGNQAIEKELAAKKLPFKRSEDFTLWYAKKRAKYWLDIPSVNYPNHLWKIGNFRSSYNHFGINNVMHAMIQRTLQDIFGEENPKNNILRPDWETIRQRTEETYQLFRRAVKYYQDETDATELHKELFPESKPSNILEAMVGIGELMQEQSAEDKDILNLSPALGYRSPEYKDMDWDSYFQSFEILLETCQYVLSQPQPGKYEIFISR